MKNSFALRVANLLQLSVLLGVASPAFGYDNGPRVIGCDFRESSTSKQKAEICFIPSSGMQMGYGWIVIRPESTKNYYRLHDNHGAELGENKRWQKAEILDGQAFGSAVIWKGNFTYRKGQCRPGGRDASIYEISNGAKFCLYY
jgi:hypothetical protein